MDLGEVRWILMRRFLVRRKVILGKEKKWCRERERERERERVMVYENGECSRSVEEDRWNGFGVMCGYSCVPKY
ncbi:hypothetical protein RchiOBHm_Chr4g0413431 [Rosa chinensis]|uniref:Uncharacterized protein n=1 Tax=Rosa chinensis TaxID=74649 RepID=A0A2P6QW39_ROSCH|nr:hypothetical protein RchiOBHm_Chr4g0413431 [Rosa chinensis]